jgi:hypothetical protein
MCLARNRGDPMIDWITAMGDNDSVESATSWRASMPEAIDPVLLDRDLEAARREFAAWERDEGRTDRRLVATHKAEKFRGPLALFLAVYPLIREADDAWRRSVFQARQPFEANTDEAVRKLYAV